MNWRITAIGIGLLVSVALTVLAWILGTPTDPSTFFGAVFASWMAGVLLFLFLGAFVAAVSLARPEQESFDARARILFRQQSGQHIDYIITRIKELLEHYAETASIRISTVDYDASENKYKLVVEGLMDVRSYIDDVASTYVSRIKMAVETDPPAGRPKARIVFLRINGNPVPECAGDHDGIVDRPFETRIAPGEKCSIEHMAEFWMRGGDEDYNYNPARYTQELTLTIDNLLETGLTLSLSTNAGSSWTERQIAQGQSLVLSHGREAEPGKELYRFRLTPP